MAQLMPPPLTLSCFSKIQIGLPFWYWLTRVVPEKGPLNGCVCVCVLQAVMQQLKPIYRDWPIGRDRTFTPLKHLPMDTCLQPKTTITDLRPQLGARAS